MHGFDVRSAAVGAVVLVAAACSGGGEPIAGGGRTTTGPATTHVRPAIPAEPSAQLLREARLYANPAPIGVVQERVGIAPVILDPGRHTFDELGTEVALTLHDHWRLDAAEPGRVLLTRPDAELESLLPGLVFLRPLGFATPSRAATGTLHPGSSGWELWDLGAWIDAMPQITVLDRGTLPIGERQVSWWDVDVDPTRGRTNDFCEPGSCVEMMWTGGAYTMVARDLERLRWYEITDPQGPIIVLVAGRDDEWDELVADAHQIVGTAAIGPSAPHPIPDGLITAEFIEAGVNTDWRFTGVEGLVFRTETAVGIGQRPGEMWHSVRDEEAVTSFVVPVADAEGDPITSTDDIMASLTGAEGVTIVDRNAEILGERAIVVDVDHDRGTHDGEPLLFLGHPRPGFRPDLAGWPTLPLNRVWVVDSPVGPALVVAAADGPDLLGAALDRLDFFTEAISFCTTTDPCTGER